MKESSVTNESLSQAQAASKHALIRMSLGGIGLVFCLGVGLALSRGALTSETDAPLALPESDPCSAVALASDAAACRPRENYLTALRALQTQLLPGLEALSFDQWALDEAHAIDAQQQSALVAFDEADYEAASERIATAEAKARALLAGVPDRLKAALKAMVDAFDANDVGEARDQLQLARWLDPSSDLVGEYGPRIAVLPEASKLEQRVAVARVENRTDEELVALEALLQLDSQRLEHRGRIAEIKRTQRESRYTQAVARAEQALASSNPARARRHMGHAAQLAPQRDLGFLLARIVRLERRQALDLALASANAAAAADQWPAARAAYEQALSIEANHKQAASGREQADAIIAAQASLAGYVAKPIRLATPRVGEFARQQLIAFKPLLSASPRLSSLEGQVQEYLKKAQVPVTVAIESDGVTDVSVRRVGLVGKHKTKRIQLTPGRYEFEGKRRGYKSALVALEIPYGVTEIAVKVVANERI